MNSVSPLDLVNRAFIAVHSTDFKLTCFGAKILLWTIQLWTVGSHRTSWASDATKNHWEGAGGGNFKNVVLGYCCCAFAKLCLTLPRFKD